MTLYGVVEYREKDSPVTWGLGRVFFPSSDSDVGMLLGLGQPEDSIVPARGLPKDGSHRLSSDANSTFMALAIKGQPSNGGTFDANGYLFEGPGNATCISEEAAERWLKQGAQWVDPEWHGEYRYITDVDMEGFNWVKYRELRLAVEIAETRNPKAHLAPHRAVLAAMKSLKNDPNMEMVRFVYASK